MAGLPSKPLSKMVMFHVLSTDMNQIQARPSASYLYTKILTVCNNFKTINPSHSTSSVSLQYNCKV